MCSRRRRAELGLGGPLALAQLHEGRHLLAPALVRRAHDHGVVDRGVVLERLLDLLGEDLLAAGVDGDRVAAEQAQLAVRVDAGAVARHRVAHAVHHREGLRGLLGVLVVAERHGAACAPASRCSAEPGSRTPVRSSFSTRLPGLHARSRRWCGSLSFVENCVACAPLSEEPRASRMRRSGSSSRNSCLSAAVRIAPPEVSSASDERS